MVQPPDATRVNPEPPAANIVTPTVVAPPQDAIPVGIPAAEQTAPTPTTPFNGVMEIPGMN